ncbi:hypothetical protein D3273_22665 [Lichenibacterium minor]|uniref:Uncharacterized protein n=1 Tax=Lichenibacterium minor TaxID=2316528 RepID=A0A4Q2U400_9HYPH|nr:hypothetical protein [Lichenibacterium minor]RYC29681.1 hypothetical protein D3273_22665 [Lichenibacterium minor]
MRATIYRVMMRPWVYRITCGVLFVILMGLTRYGLNVLKNTNDTALILEVGVPAIVVIFALAWLIDRHDARPH